MTLTGPGPHMRPTGNTTPPLKNENNDNDLNSTP